MLHPFSVNVFVLTTSRVPDYSAPVFSFLGQGLVERLKMR